MSITHLKDKKEDSLNLALFKLKKKISGRLEQGFYSTFRGYGLRRDLTVPLVPPEAKIPISIRPLMPKDIETLLPETGIDSAEERQQIAWRRHFHRKVPHGCYVAVDQRNGTPCYMQWLISSHDNDLLSKFKCFPRLADDEALLEQAYTHPDYRGMRIMPAAMAIIAERATSFGARYVLTFVDEKHEASIKGCLRSGFQNHLSHRRLQIGYGTVVSNSFKKLPANDPRRNLKI